MVIESVPRPEGSGWLVLIGGGEFSFGETKEIDEFLLSVMPPGRTAVSFLPAASGSVDYARHFGAYLEELSPGVGVVNVPIYRKRDTRREKHLSAIRSSGMVYLGGGVTNAIADVLVETPLTDALRDALAAGAVVAAIGASAAALGARAISGVTTEAAIQGAGLLPRCAVMSGFDPERDTSLRRLVSLPDVDLGIGLPVRTALAIDEAGRGRIVGEGSVALMRKPPATPARS